MNFQAGRDWYAIEKIEENLYNVKRQGSGDYEQYETDKAGVEKLKAQAISEII